MTNMIQEIKSQIAVMIDRAMEKAVSDGVIPCKFEGEILVEKPREKSHGDYATNVAMQMAKAAKKNPRALAQDLLDRFDFSGTYVASAEIAGPGFLNFRLDPVWRADALRLIAKEGSRYGRQDYGKGEKSDGGIHQCKSHRSHAYGKRPWRRSGGLFGQYFILGRL